MGSIPLSSGRMVHTFLALLGLVCLYLPATDAYWRLPCGIIQTGRIDPIISPGAVAGHTHSIAGAVNIGVNTSYSDLMQSRCTSCSVSTDKSAYWTPQLFYQFANGSFTPVPHSGTVVYYLDRGVNARNIEPFPPGFKMLSGDAGVRSYDDTTLTNYGNPYQGRPIADRVSFACLDVSGPSKEQPYMWRTDCSNGMRAQIHFQSCWNGGPYKADQSHVAYMSEIDNGVCPPTHPRQLAHVFFEVLYNVNEVAKETGGRFVLAQGDTTGYGFHGDFLAGWDPDVQLAAIKQCMNIPNSDGSIASCPPLHANENQFAGSNCPEQPPIINEQVKGIFAKLPGCNNVTSGPARAASGGCTAAPPTINKVNLTSSSEILDLTSAAKVGHWQYIGCQADNGVVKALSTAKYNDSHNMTIDSCVAFCKSKNLPLAGMEFGSECYCGSQLSTISPLRNATSCTSLNTALMSCTGNNTQYCGAPSLLTIFNDTGSSTPGSTGVTSGPTMPVPGKTTVSKNTGIYLGCFAEPNGGRALSLDRTSDSTTMTNNQCAAYCQKGNYALFGTEFSEECFCGNTLPVGITKLDETGCAMNCKGNATQFCGGPSRLSVYNSTLYAPVQNPSNPNHQFTYQSCYTEGTSGRTLGSKGTSASYSMAAKGMTVETCSSICFTKGYMYMGVEFGKECYCNNLGPINNAKVANETDCSIVCDGNKKEWCGGSSRISVYKKIGI